MLGRNFLVCVNRMHHLKVRLAFGRERLYIRITPIARLRERAPGTHWMGMIMTEEAATLPDDANWKML
jgi:hypothetical protein